MVIDGLAWNRLYVENVYIERGDEAKITTELLTQLAFTMSVYHIVCCFYFDFNHFLSIARMLLRWAYTCCYSTIDAVFTTKKQAIANKQIDCNSKLVISSFSIRVYFVVYACTHTIPFQLHAWWQRKHIQLRVNTSITNASELIKVNLSHIWTDVILEWLFMFIFRFCCCCCCFGCCTQCDNTNSWRWKLKRKLLKMSSS